MHLSMHNWMRAEPLEVTIRRLAQYGYQSIEIGGEPYKYDTKEVRRLLKEYGIRCWGSISLMFTGLDLIQADEAGRAKTIQYLKDCVTMVKELDGTVMSIVPSEVGKIQPQADPDTEWRWAVEGLREINDHAKQAGIRIAIEPLNRFETNFLNRHDQALLLAKEVGENCGVCLDAFHMNIEEANFRQALLNTGALLYDLHVADNNRMAPGMGALNWRDIVGTLREIGYDGALTVEFVPPIDRTPANPYPDATATPEDELTPEQLKFIEDHGSGILSEKFYSWLVEETAKTLLPLIR
ncbi:sugar phosphate isomerase/epimerase [Litorilinea aerophila]|uniref:Sugar phosphate isomerase/epimerase n=1 Tax=Litorilinea aerophila TaxID=1204385 RepID=A0A540V9Y5_9CHLR|nr:sugar phosphate isomerase/epimerase [Litorilinea aerophila]MCC9078546.1 sugar phosphate isomerase/epimerase [Litorilinea aerophila]OUC04895.1 epimerase [Litorilinea aerophila]GIV79937.1 MAG: epimerase [Litorilinea sp.]